MKIGKSPLSQVLAAQGDTEADGKLAELPDEIDTERDADALEAVGLGREELMAKLAAGGLGGSIAP